MGPEVLIAICVAVIILFVLLAGILSRYRKCPSDKVLVIYGKVGSDKNGQTKTLYSRRCSVDRAGDSVISVYGSDADFY